MNITPRGCVSIGGELAYGMEECRGGTLGLFTAYGYNPFNPAEFQLLEGTMKNLHRRRRERVIAVNSPFGEPCCLRADITLSALSYMALHHTPEEFPLRLCYAERVFASPRAPKENLEDTQVGVELLGWEGLGSDVEVIALLLRALDALGLTDSVIVLGDASIVPELFSNIPGALAERLVDYLHEGMYHDFERTLSQADSLSERDGKTLGELPSLKGTVEVLDYAENLFGSPGLLEPLRKICSSLERLGFARRVRIDLGFIRDLGYYTGPMFNVYSSTQGVLLGGGGRYDGSLADTRFSCQAVGFGISLRELALARKPAQRASRVMIWSGGPFPDRALSYAASLADCGVSFEISWNADAEASRLFAALRGCSWWVDVEEDSAYELATGRSVTPSEIGGAGQCR
ncbi:MAG: ATP phosphoribosyltransferase regulatory subunit [Synergistaceae bacterium]|nr:ATP phosphoribosyltransferase regulatory subunit [Synergistaceae bacterium]